ncbi:FAD:protein FMN transferase [Rhizobium sp. AN5]|uniref:FAD:protein FMN transferase n=1 Tax=Rhizobium sp. AN5 TaxID=1855304 RepID=UPI00117B9793|nr:FAD:protein FMN transferase [Rhizobium sp. AN5]
MLTFSLKFDAIGTSWEIDTPAPLAEVTKAHLLELVERFDSIYSRFRHESIVMRIANAADGGTFSFPVDAIPKFDLYDRLYAVTDGAVDPLVGRDLELLGYDSDYTLVPDDGAITLMATQRPVWHRDVQREGHAITTRRPPGHRYPNNSPWRPGAACARSPQGQDDGARGRRRGDARLCGGD